MKKLVLALTALSLIGGAVAPSTASGCRDKHGKFIKCPKMCRDSKGHFKKCK
jgi:hypothetical protein